jgi:hypothetical protein
MADIYPPFPPQAVMADIYPPFPPQYAVAAPTPASQVLV